MIDVEELKNVALALQAAHPNVPARLVLDAVMMVAPGSELQYDPVQRLDTSWLDAHGPFGEMLREALAPEVEDDFLGLMNDPDPEARRVFGQLWEEAVIKRFGRLYLGWV